PAVRARPVAHRAAQLTYIVPFGATVIDGKLLSRKPALGVASLKSAPFKGDGMSSSVLTTVIGRVKWIPPSSDFENTMAFGAKRFRDSSQATYTSPAGPVRTTEPCTPPQPMLQLRERKTGFD